MEKRNLNQKLVVAAISLCFIFALGGADKCDPVSKDGDGEDANYLTCPQGGYCTYENEDGKEARPTVETCMRIARKKGCPTTKVEIDIDTSELRRCCQSIPSADPTIFPVDYKENERACIQEIKNLDMDGDGYSCVADKDCDDANANVNPGANEIVGNVVDEDCDGIKSGSGDPDDGCRQYSYGVEVKDAQGELVGWITNATVESGCVNSSVCTCKNCPCGQRVPCHVSEVWDAYIAAAAAAGGEMTIQQAQTKFKNEFISVCCDEFGFFDGQESQCE